MLKKMIFRKEKEMATLYEINTELMNLIDDETGEITDIEKWNELNLTADQKVENIGCWVKNLKSDIDALKAEEKALQDRRKTAENKVKYLTGHLEGYLNGQKFETAKVKLSFRKSKVLEIAEGVKVPEEYLRYKDPEVNKTELKKAVKAGLQLQGVQLVKTLKLQLK